MLNGVALSDGAWHTLTAAQFAQLVYVAGSSAGTDTVEIKAYDGKTWSSAYSTKETTTAPSSPTTPVSLLEELGFTATAAAALITASGSPTYSGSLTYNNMLAILNQAAVGGMTATKFSALQSLASMLNQSGGLSTSAYVQQIADDVINGNSANASWNGGSSTATKLGNLSATSTQTQVDDLIDKWFLGTDLPSLSVSAIGESNYNPTYQTSALPLFNPNTNAPSYLDVNQGYLGDCYFVAALGEVALQDPSAIENMITDNGNGTYSVLFYVNGQPDYVTVNGELPYMSGGYQWANGSTQEFANGTPPRRATADIRPETRTKTSMAGRRSRSPRSPTKRSTPTISARANRRLRSIRWRRFLPPISPPATTSSCRRPPPTTAIWSATTCSSSPGSPPPARSRSRTLGTPPIPARCR
jgi:hypothetical protein